MSGPGPVRVPGNPPRTEELDAARILVVAIQGAAVTHVREQSHGEWDIDLHLPDGSTEPVEVTASTNYRLEALYGAIARQPFVLRRVAAQDWYVTPLENANAGRMRQNLDRYLADIESAGRGEFYADRDAADCEAVRRIRDDLQIEAGRVLPIRPGYIAIGYPGGGGAMGGDLIAFAVNAELAKGDNRRSSGRRTQRAAIFSSALIG